MPKTTPSRPEPDFSNIEIIDRDGQKWITAADLANALGFKNSSSVTRIHRRNPRDFDADMTWSVKLTGQVQAREHLVFSLRGARMVALLAKTRLAESFRKWVLDLIEQETPREAVAAEPDPEDTAHHILGVTHNAMRIAQDMRVIETAMANLHRADDNTPLRDLLANQLGARAALMEAEIAEVREALAPHLATQKGRYLIQNLDTFRKEHGLLK